MATLKISDLSVGDWVRYEDKIYKLYAIEECGLLRGVCKDSENIAHIVKNIDYFDPIPITAEILERNGFEEDNNGHYALKIGGIVAVDIEYTGGIWELSILDVYALQYAGKMQVTIAFVSSIHNLQHALRLAGIDKEINL